MFFLLFSDVPLNLVILVPISKKITSDFTQQGGLPWLLFSGTLVNCFSGNFLVVTCVPVFRRFSSNFCIRWFIVVYPKNGMTHALK